jgi:protein-S-isoprenylcysteine O-methyltransferase Ste14
MREEHHLITSGPYAHIRHPIYIAISGFGIGFALVSGNWIFVALAVVFIAGLLVRIPREEQMIGEFGDQDRVYMQRTGRLLPR